MSRSKLAGAMLLLGLMLPVTAGVLTAPAGSAAAVHASSVDCVAVGVTTYADGQVWAVEDCDGVRLSTKMSP